MAVTRHVSKSCCGSQVFVLETSLPIRRTQIQFFREAGYLIPNNFFEAGIFYVQSEQLVATCAFGTTRINVRCNGSTCLQLLSSFEALLEKATNS